MAGRVRRELASGGRGLTAPTGESAALGQALRAVPAFPWTATCCGYIGEVREIVRRGAELRAVVDVREAVQ